MALYALSDPHLSHGVNKPMDIFGNRWKDHTQRIKYFWERTVTENDTVVLPGDISWGMTLEEALPDLLFLESLPGKKILSKGNHDYWWVTLSKIKKAFEEHKIESIDLLYNNAFPCEDYAICGSRGWFTENASPSGTDFDKIVAREAGRIERSLIAGMALDKKEPLVFLHFPPVMNDFVCREILDVLHKYGVKRCFYGHMHGIYTIPPTFVYEEIAFTIVAADHLQFDPLLIP
jgi:predicted phosphohydrolase